MAAPTVAEPNSGDSSSLHQVQTLIQEVTFLHDAIAALPSLSPSPAVNALFTRLVRACIPPCPVDVSALPEKVQATRASLLHLCADAEALLESHFCDLLAAHDNPLDHLALFPYFSNYLSLAGIEHRLLIGSSGDGVSAPPPQRVAFIGSGPLPLSSIVLASRHLRASRFHNYDRCGDANARARRLVRADADFSARMAFHTADVMAVTNALGAYDAVFLAALVGMEADEKRAVVAHLGRHMAPGAALVVRSAHGARAFLYPVVEPEEVRVAGFDVLAVHHPEDEVINSVIVARKPLNSVINSAVAHVHGGSVSGRSCKQCELETAGGMKKKMEEVQVEELPSS